MDKDIKRLFEPRNGISVSEHRFAILLPQKDRDGNALSLDLHHAYKDMIMTFFIRELGGGTNYEGAGYFEDDTKQLHVEDVTICESFCSKEQLKEHAPLLRAMCNLLQIELNQHSIAAVVDGEMVFFEPTESYTQSMDHENHVDRKSIIKILESYMLPALAKGPKGVKLEVQSPLLASLV